MAPRCPDKSDQDSLLCSRKATVCGPVGPCFEAFACCKPGDYVGWSQICDGKNHFGDCHWRHRLRRQTASQPAAVSSSFCPIPLWDKPDHSASSSHMVQHSDINGVFSGTISGATNKNQSLIQLIALRFSQTSCITVLL